MGRRAADDRDTDRPTQHPEGYQVTQLGAFAICAGTFGAGACSQIEKLCNKHQCIFQNSHWQGTMLSAEQLCLPEHVDKMITPCGGCKPDDPNNVLSCVAVAVMSIISYRRGLRKYAFLAQAMSAVVFNHGAHVKPFVHVSKWPLLHLIEGLCASSGSLWRV